MSSYIIQYTVLLSCFLSWVPPEYIKFFVYQLVLATCVLLETHRRSRKNCRVTNQSLEIRNNSINYSMRQHRRPPPPPPPPPQSTINSILTNVTTTATVINTQIPPPPAWDQRWAARAPHNPSVPMTTFSPVNTLANSRQTQDVGSVPALAATPSIPSITTPRPVRYDPIPPSASMSSIATGTSVNITVENEKSAQPVTATAVPSAKAVSTPADNHNTAEFNCAICLQDVPLYTQLVMPCCGNVDSTAKFCATCIDKVAEMGVQGRFGKCPLCPLYFTIRQGTVVLQKSVPRPCRICRMERELVDGQRMLCALCVVGTQHRFNYECRYSGGGHVCSRGD